MYLAAGYAILRITVANGTVSLFAGSNAYATTDGTGTAARFNNVTGLCIDPTNTILYASEYTGNVIRRITVPGAVVTTIAGTVGTAGYLDATGTRAIFNNPTQLTLDSTGSNLYITDQSGAKIRKLNIATCNVTTYAGTGVAGFADGSVPTTTVVNNSLVTTATHYPYELYFSNYVPYGQIKLNQGSENGMFFYDCYPNAAGNTQNGWYLANSGNAIAQSNSGGKGFAITRINGGSVSTTAGLYMLSNGYVGINCNAPAYMLDVSGTFRACNVVIGSNFGSGTNSTLILQQQAGGNAAGVASTTRFAFAAYSSYGAVSAIDSIQFSDSNFRSQMAFSTATAANVLGQALFLDSNQTVKISGYTTNGTVTTTSSTGLIAISSDIRLKTNIQYVQEIATSKIEALKPARFEWKADLSNVQLGFIAQDVESVIPEAVDGKKYEYEWSKDSNGNPILDSNGQLVMTDIPRYRGFSDRPIIATLVKAFQELSARLSNVEARLAAAGTTGPTGTTESTGPTGPTAATTS